MTTAAEEALQDFLELSGYDRVLPINCIDDLSILCETEEEKEHDQTRDSIQRTTEPHPNKT